MARNREQNQGKGRNRGQGIANLTDQQRRDLAASGDDAPTEDQRDTLTSGEQGHARETRRGERKPTRH